MNKSIAQHLLAGLLALGSSSAALADCQGNENAAAPETTPTETFVDRGNGLILHLPTRLVWQRCALGQSWTGSGCNGEADLLDWSAALQAASANDDGGHDDWRLPNRNELASIVETRCHGPAINGGIFPDHPSAGFWTSSSASDPSAAVWVVDFDHGNVEPDTTDGLRGVRLVRSGRF